MNTTYRLRLRVLLAMAAFLLGVAGTATYQLNALVVSENSYALLGQLDRLQGIVATLPDTGANYVANAPRNYESYNRDVQVFMRELVGDLDRIELAFTELEAQFSGHTGFALPMALQGLVGGEAQLMALDDALGQTREIWNDFRTGFREQLGDEEPRLEWGAQFIVAQTPELQEALQRMDQRYRDFLDGQHRVTERVSQIALILLLILGLIGLLVMNQRVFRRIAQTVDGCAHVANGEFGYTVPVTGNDELSALGRAFNTLSVRSQLVLNMLTQLQLAETVEQALGVVVNASGSTLPVSWAGFMAVGEEGRRFALTNALPPKTLTNWTQRQIQAPGPGDTGKVAGFGRDLRDSLIGGTPLRVADLRRRAVEDDSQSFLQDLVRATQVESLVVLPLTSPDGWQGLVLFGSRSARYTEAQVELLKNLAPAMAISFQRILG